MCFAVIFHLYFVFFFTSAFFVDKKTFAFQSNVIQHTIKDKN